MDPVPSIRHHNNIAFAYFGENLLVLLKRILIALPAHNMVSSVFWEPQRFIKIWDVLKVIVNWIDIDIPFKLIWFPIHIHLEHRRELRFAFKMIFSAFNSLYSRQTFSGQLMHEFNHTVSEWPEGILAAFIDRSWVNWDDAINSVLEPTSCSHCGSAAERVAKYRKAIQTVAVSKSEDIIRKHFIIHIVMVIWASMIPQLNQVAVALSWDWKLLAKPAPISFRA